MTVDQFIADYIKRWEGGLSLDPKDTGNWVGKKLVGSNFGVTAAALAKHRGVPVDAITQPVMRDLTLAEAVAIGKAGYFTAPKFDLLPWNRVTASIVDFGWNAGPSASIKVLQGLIGATVDGVLGPKTADTFKRFCVSHGENGAALLWADSRNRFYDAIVARRADNAKYLKGWKNRTAYFTPSSEWWGRFAA